MKNVLHLKKEITKKYKTTDKLQCPHHHIKQQTNFNAITTKWYILKTTTETMNAYKQIPKGEDMAYHLESTVWK